VTKHRFTQEIFWGNFSFMSPVTRTEQSEMSALPLHEKALRLGLSRPVDLERLAIMRGCDYYDRELPPRIQPLVEVPMSNAERAIVLISPSLHPTAREVRLSAVLLGAPDVQAQEVAELAVRESCADIVRYIALCGRRFEPANSF
jgi:hypothetical protein